MKLTRRRFLTLVADAGALPILSRPTRAQSYPNRYVRLIVPFPPGGSADPIARVIANRLTEIWGQQVVIENRSGAGGNIGAQAAAQSAPDGYTLLIGGSFLAVNPFLYSAIVDPLKDLAPVARICAFTTIMTVPNSSPAKSVAEFIEYARANRGKLTFASSGTGASPHLTGELFKRMAGIELTHVPYRGAGPAMSDLLVGRVDSMFATLPSVLEQVRSGALRPLGVASGTRSPFIPEVPTIAESGVPGFDLSDGYGLFFPAKATAEIIRKVHDDTVTAVTYPAVQQRLEAIAASPVTSTPSELAAWIKSEMEKWGPLITELGIKAG